MDTNDEINRIQSEIEDSQERLREDVSQIKEKVDETRAQLSPTGMVQRRLPIFLGGAMALGFWIGYSNVPLPEIAAPAARTMLSSAGTHAAARLIRRS
jgi:hypothetical protein